MQRIHPFLYLAVEFEKILRDGKKINLQISTKRFFNRQGAKRSNSSAITSICNAGYWKISKWKM